MSLTCGEAMLVWSALFGVLFVITFLTPGLMEFFWRLVRVFSGGRRNCPSFVFVGLDNSGKTTMLHMLRQVILWRPSQRPKFEELHREAQLNICGNMVRVYDYGSISDFRAVDGVVFFIDAADLNRLGDAIYLLNHLPKHMPLLILGTKMDLKGVISETELCSRISSPWIVACQGFKVYICLLIARCSSSSSVIFVCRCCLSSDVD